MAAEVKSEEEGEVCARARSVCSTREHPWPALPVCRSRKRALGKGTAATVSYVDFRKFVHTRGFTLFYLSSKTSPVGCFLWSVSTLSASCELKSSPWSSLKQTTKAGKQQTINIRMSM